MIKINQQEYHPQTICTAIKNFIAVYHETDCELEDDVFKLYALDDTAHKTQLYHIQLCEDDVYGYDSCFCLAIVCYDDDGKFYALDYVYRTKNITDLLSKIDSL